MLSKSPELPYSCVQPLQYFGAARDALHVVLANLDLSNGKKLLIPAYIGITEREGSGVFDPVQQTSTPYEFYALDRKLSALKNDLYNLIRSEKYEALLVIHYFGFCQNDMEEIVYLCKRHDVLLIEDCAHTMRSEVRCGQLGMLGDFSFYSIHKYLAATEGGCLRVNNRDYDHLVRLQTHAKPKPETLDIILRSDLDAIRDKRRSNYQDLMERIIGYSGIELMYPELPDGIAPHNLPIIIKDGRRESVYFKLVNSGIPVIALYYRMIVPIMEGAYANSLYVSDNIMNLPVHQDINEDDIKIISRELKKSLNT